MEQRTLWAQQDWTSSAGPTLRVLAVGPAGLSPRVLPVE